SARESGTSQPPAGFVAMPVLQDTMVRILSFLEGMSQARALPGTANGSRVRDEVWVNEGMHHEAYRGGDKRPHHQDVFNGSQPRGGGFPSRGYPHHFQPSRPIQEAPHITQGSLSSGQTL
ncbi:hypothetical protein HAX54_035850, partial [Datura stramonium]|nr:hypothetical protein [Datura stramonium]